MSKTEKNLHEAFAGESMARNKYTYWAEQARKEGFHYIAKIFDETAENERRHAKDEFILLGGIGDTVANLKAAMEGEDYEVTTMYENFAKEADEEGNKEAALLFKQIQKVEAHHRDRYKRLLEMVEKDTVFEREHPIKWKCGVCGYIHEGKTPPEKCPCCKHSKNHYEPANLDL
ncbi:MAG: rubrerythrin family protein [Spirochaetes bacterium]|nr:rubrerythrin family protein [Spirochaetota bacterium]MBN2771014.1 rubrerythrin family protein [Spirochaetota bacterium]